MLVTLGLYARRWHRLLRRRLLDPRFHALAQAVGYFLAGLLSAATSLGNAPMPLTLGLLCAVSGWPAVLLWAGGTTGYMALWGAAGVQGPVWLALGLCVSLLLKDRPITRQTPFLVPALAGVITALTGLAFQLFGVDALPVSLYLLRIAMAILCAGVFTLGMERRDPVADWAISGLCVLALAQVMPIPYLGFGYIAAGLLAAAGAFPAAALAGLALDLAQITPVPMTAVLCFAWFLRLLPRLPKWLRYAAPAIAFLPVMALSGRFDMLPLPGLAIGGLCGLLLPDQPALSHRRGETGFAQVRLEMAAAVLEQSEHLLSDVPEYPIDEPALIQRAVNGPAAAAPAARPAGKSRKTSQPPCCTSPSATEATYPCIAVRQAGFFRSCADPRSSCAPSGPTGTGNGNTGPQWYSNTAFWQIICRSFPICLPSGPSRPSSNTSPRSPCALPAAAVSAATGVCGLPVWNASTTFCCATAWAPARRPPALEKALPP